jgi:signal transduction histidine kinase
LRASAENLQALSRRLVETQENYRREPSRELHYRVGQNLTALNINLDMALNSLPPSLKPKLGPRLMDSLALVNSTVDAIEDVMLELRPPMLDDYGLPAALRWLFKQFTHRTGINVALRDSGQLERMDSAAEVALYRIVQEALTNVAKHAQARHVDITVDHQRGKYFTHRKRRRDWIRFRENGSNGYEDGLGDDQHARAGAGRGRHIDD